MDQTERLRSRLLAAFSRVAAELGDQLPETARRLLEQSRERLASGHYTVVVCGEFRRGKSSLLNALVEREDLFPVDLDVTTSVVTTLAWGEEEYALVHLHEDGSDDRTSRVERIELSEVATFVTEQSNPGNDRRVRLVEMFAPVPELATGLVLADTPGLGSLNAEHTVATRAFLREADAVLFVGSSVEPMSTVDYAFLGEALRRCPVVLTAVTMIDRSPDPDPIVRSTQERVAQLIHADPSEVQVVPVSAARKWEALDQDDADLLQKSGFPALETALWSGLGRTCVARALTTGIGVLQGAVATAAAPLRNEYAALDADQAGLAAIEEELAATLGRAQKLTVDGAQWRRDLKEEFVKELHGIAKDLDRRTVQLRTDFTRAADTDAGRADPDALVTTFNDGLLAALQDAVDSVDELVDRLGTRYTAVTDLPLVVERSGDTLFEVLMSPTATQVGEEKSSRFSRFRASWGGGMAMGGAGTMIGAITGTFLLPGIGSVLGGGIGGLIGQAWGMFAGHKEAKRQAALQEKREQTTMLRTVVQSQLEVNRAQALRDFQTVADARYALLAQRLEDQLAATRESLNDSVTTLQKQGKQTHQQREERKRKLEQRARDLADMRRALESLQDDVDEL